MLMPVVLKLVPDQAKSTKSSSKSVARQSANNIVSASNEGIENSTMDDARCNWQSGEATVSAVLGFDVIP